jgi:hypothetical protein
MSNILYVGIFVDDIMTGVLFFENSDDMSTDITDYIHDSGYTLKVISKSEYEKF